MYKFASTLLARTNSVQIWCSKFGIHLLSLQTWVNSFFRPVSIAIPVAGKEGRSQSEEIGGDSHDEVGGGIGFLRFEQCSMG